MKKVSVSGDVAVFNEGEVFRESGCGVTSFVFVRAAFGKGKGRAGTGGQMSEVGDGVRGVTITVTQNNALAFSWFVWCSDLCCVVVRGSVFSGHGGWVRVRDECGLGVVGVKV